MAILPGFKSFERYLKTDSGYQKISERTLARDVLLDDGNNVSEHLGSIYNNLNKLNERFPDDNTLQVGDSVMMCSDSEGGNICLSSPANIGGHWEIDGTGGKNHDMLRFFHVRDGELNVEQVLPVFSFDAAACILNITLP